MGTKIGNRILETSNTAGAGTYTLLGSAPGKQAFLDDVNISTGDSVLYCAFDGAQWEIGVGTITSGASDTLSRDTIIRSSDGATAIVWAAGTRTIISDVPAQALLDLIDRAATPGLLARTATWAYAWRTITAGQGVTVTNGDGGAGSPDIALANQTKGDLLSFQASGALSVLPAETNGMTLSLDSTTNSGLKWTSQTGDSFGRNTALGLISLGV